MFGNTLAQLAQSWLRSLRPYVVNAKRGLSWSALDRKRSIGRNQNVLKRRLIALMIVSLISLMMGCVSVSKNSTGTETTIRVLDAWCESLPSLSKYDVLQPETERSVLKNLERFSEIAASRNYVCNGE